jgi:hypothetical protein
MTAAQKLAALYRSDRDPLTDPPPSEWFRTSLSTQERWWPQYDEPIYSELLVDVIEGRVPGAIPQ